ncbi:hypothetical protein PF003_g21171 [Phytophthora fragariae]|nr:hypothetical protein PF003_g21171 [Phytophthora fragariae]
MCWLLTLLLGNDSAAGHEAPLPLLLSFHLRN